MSQDVAAQPTPYRSHIQLSGSEQRCLRYQTSPVLYCVGMSSHMDVMWRPDGPNLIVQGDNLAALTHISDQCMTLIYLDPPFNTGRAQTRQTLSTLRSPTGDRVGFQGQHYASVKTTLASYDDAFGDYWSFLEPRLREAWRVLADDGTLYLHLDYREVHYAKVMLDALFGRECFLNEIIWAYDFGGRSKRRWPAKHDNILVYCKNPDLYHFDNAAVDREPYMSPGWVTPEQRSKGKLPTDVWWHTIVPTNGKEKTGYPTQKPEGVLRRIVLASSRPSDWVLDFFAGSGTTGAVAAQHNRKFVMVDSNPQACAVMAKRLEAHTVSVIL